MKMNTNVIAITGTVTCPDGNYGPRREIRIPRESTNRLPIGRFPINRGKAATHIKLLKDGDVYDTGLRRYEKDSYITDGTQTMGYHLKQFLQRYGRHNRGKKVQMEVQGYNFLIV